MADSRETNPGKRPNPEERGYDDDYKNSRNGNESGSRSPSNKKTSPGQNPHGIDNNNGNKNVSSIGDKNNQLTAGAKLVSGNESGFNDKPVHQVFQLRVKTRDKQAVINTLTRDNTIGELKEMLFQISEIPIRLMRVKIGYPPKPIDINDDLVLLKEIFPRARDAIILEDISEGGETKSHGTSQASTNRTPLLGSSVVNKEERIKSQTTKSLTPKLIRHIVPANNSCLFNSVYFCCTEGEYDNEKGNALRQVISDEVKANPLLYNEAVLEKKPDDYCKWIMNRDHWGGAIELNILSKYIGMEIVAVDTINGIYHRFGEDQNYQKRIFLIYDGIHYDPLVMKTINNSIRTQFYDNEKNVFDLSLEVAKEMRDKRQFVDINNFKLRCLVCDKGFHGHAEATEHAKLTLHANFAEFHEDDNKRR